MDLNVNRLNAKVLLNGKIPGIINSIQICSGYTVKYSVVYWDETTRKEEWVHPFELDIENYSDTVQIGFIQ